MYALHTLHTLRTETRLMVDSETVYQRLREQLVSGVYQAGDRLPEAALSTELAVSRTPVREALRRLESDGLVRSSGRGVRVIAMTAAAVQHAHAVRAALEALTAELAAGQQLAGRLAPGGAAGGPRELLAPISRGDGPLAGRIAADHARATANTTTRQELARCRKLIATRQRSPGPGTPGPEPAVTAITSVPTRSSPPGSQPSPAAPIPHSAVMPRAG